MDASSQNPNQPHAVPLPLSTENQTAGSPLESFPDIAPTATDTKNEDGLNFKSASVDEPTLSERLRDIQDATLRFLANASNETLGACAVGLCASTYLVLGRVGLVLIGAVGGVVLHATWEHSQHGVKEGADEASRKRRELGLEVARRALNWRDLHQSSAKDADTRKTHDAPDFSNLPPATREALTNFTNAVIRDYVRWWYTPILPLENLFPATCKKTLTSFLTNVSSHLSRKRRADPFLDFIANSTSIIIVFLNELSNALRASPNTDVETAIQTYLEYSPNSSLANVLDVQQQERKFNFVAEDILQTFLESATYDCVPVRVFLREVLCGLILKATVESCSKAEWLNGWIVYMLEDGEPELMNAIDVDGNDVSQGINIKANGKADAAGKKVHQRRVSRAEVAMQEAMQEAQRMNEMIAEDEARRRRGDNITEADDTASATDVGIPTPPSSTSEAQFTSPSLETSMVFDIEGNAIPSGANTPAKVTSPTKEKSSIFGNLDLPLHKPAPPPPEPTSTPPPPTESMIAVPLTLHNALITILDLGASNDKVVMKQRPNEEMLIQIEPAASKYPGWMVSRRYADFEPLHDVLKRIAVISGIPEFSQKHVNVPAWKGQTRAFLIGELETYLRSAMHSERLAECEAMKKFLEKDTGLDRIPSANKNVLLQSAAALDNVGKGFINVLGQGGKNLAGGGKAVLGGVQGVFGAVATGVGVPKKPQLLNKAGQGGAAKIARGPSPLGSARPSEDLSRSSFEISQGSRPSITSRTSGLSFEGTRAMSVASQPDVSEESLHLPPPPSEISDEFVPVARQQTHPRVDTDVPPPRQSSISSFSAKAETPASPSPAEAATSARLQSISGINQSPVSPQTTTSPKTLTKPTEDPLTDEETRITVDLIFAIITSTYSLSSAWTIRLSLLSAAKTFLLRPQNPQLDSIRHLIQESLINANTSDAGIASHINTLRANSLPTEEERAKWPPYPPSDREKEELRIKARKLLVERGMPQALTSVMGQAASGEALGKVFDCLQVEKVARGIVFALMLQAIRAVMT